MALVSILGIPLRPGHERYFACGTLTSMGDKHGDTHAALAVERRWRLDGFYVPSASIGCAAEMQGLWCVHALELVTLWMSNAPACSVTACRMPTSVGRKKETL